MGEISYTIDAAEDLTTVTAIGDITSEDIKNTITQYAAEDHTSKVLWDFLEANAGDMTSEEFRSIHEHSAALFVNEPKRSIAVVVKRKLGYGLSRMSGTYRSFLFEEEDYNTFYSIEEALKWLNERSA